MSVQKRQLVHLLLFCSEGHHKPSPNTVELCTVPKDSKEGKAAALGSQPDQLRQLTWSSCARA